MQVAEMAPNIDSPSSPPPGRTDIAIIGSGFSGLAMAVRLKRAGHTDFVVLERSADVGGTWRDNSYPGCACDVPSHLYSFSFAPNPEWSSTFSPQPEIHGYIRKVASDTGVIGHVRFNCNLEEASWDEAAQRWRLRTSRGEVSARVLIAAGGPLSEPSIPNLNGLDRFQGKVFHSAQWDHDHDLTGERVAVIGTGASAIQFVPQIQPRVGTLHLFQRTAPWVMPRRSRPLTRVERAIYRRLPGAQRLMRASIYWGREVYALPLLRAGLKPITTWMGRSHLKRHVPDPELRRKLTPDYAPGCKRILISNDYLPALAQPNVAVVTDGIAEVREHSIVTADGEEREVDTIIFGTGFHVSDFPMAHRLRDGAGRTLAELWDGSMSAHKGTTIAGFPNLFLLLGPNTGLGHTSVVLMAEWQAGYVMRAIDHMEREELGAIDVRPAAVESWTAQMQRRMRGTVWLAGGCNSWYLDAQGRNSTLWPGFTFQFRRALSRFDASSYVGQPLPATRRRQAAAATSVAA
jgi:cation diffusion facilitator CzcD-associated flavoprotein CzcO